MAAGWPTKANYATGDVLSATNMNDLSGTLNYIDPTSATDGQILTRDAASAGKVKWATAAGGGKVKQVVQAEYNTSTAIASTTFTDTGLTATITPTANTSKILVIVSQPMVIGFASGYSVGAGAQIVRGSTAVFVQAANKDSLYFSMVLSGIADLQVGTVNNMLYLDSPATTSATTYKTQAAVSSTASGRSVTAQYDSTKSTITLIEIGA